MKNRTRGKKVLAAVLAFVLIGFILYLAQGFIGNPISKMIVNNSARKYVDKEYKDLDLELGEAFYNFKTGRYTVDAKSKTSIDTHFEINFRGRGKLEYDSYKDTVLSKWNTWERINDEYATLVDTVFSDNFLYEKGIAYGELVDTHSNFKHLELDKKYNIKEIGGGSGKVTLYVQSGVIDKETILKVLLEAKKIFDKNEVPFNQIDLTLEEAKADDSSQGESIEIMEFLYKDIYIEGLEKRVEENIEATKKLYEEMDKEMQEEIEEHEKEKEEVKR